MACILYEKAKEVGNRQQSLTCVAFNFPLLRRADFSVWQLLCFSNWSCQRSPQSLFLPCQRLLFICERVAMLRQRPFAACIHISVFLQVIGISHGAKWVVQHFSQPYDEILWLGPQAPSRKIAAANIQCISRIWAGECKNRCSEKLPTIPSGVLLMALAVNAFLFSAAWLKRSKMPVLPVNDLSWQWKCFTAER